MEINDLYFYNESIVRILSINDAKALVIDCIKRTMPFFVARDEIDEDKKATEDDLLKKTGITPLPYEELNQPARKVCHERYTIIAPIIPFLADEKERSRMINIVSEQNNISRQTVRHYLTLFLCFQNITVLSPAEKKEKELTADEKNFRWALNKYFYSWKKFSLKTTYISMLAEKYTVNGQLYEKYPSFYQFCYFYRKNKNMQTFLIKREGKSEYQKNHRPLLGEGICEIAPNVGIGMVDSTIADVFILDEAGQPIRPIITACIDACTSLCMGVAVAFEGGTKIVNMLLNNIIANKVEYCHKRGIDITYNQWPCEQLPAQILSDNGREFAGSFLENLADLGVTIANLPPYRPDLKGHVEKFFDLLQNYYKPFLEGKGFLHEYFQQRGAPDYRLQACLSLDEFERIVTNCVIFYNNSRVFENFELTKEMISKGVQPNASSIFAFMCKQKESNLIPVEKEKLRLILLPRTEGEFTRKGLIVNKLRYRAEGFGERFLIGGKVTVAFDPADASSVWLFENGEFVEFKIIEKRYSKMSIGEIEDMKNAQKILIAISEKKKIQAQIDLNKKITNIINKNSYGGGNNG